MNLLTFIRDKIGPAICWLLVVAILLVGWNFELDPETALIVFLILCCLYAATH